MNDPVLNIFDDTDDYDVTTSKAMGGTELIYKWMTERADPKLLDQFQIISSRLRKLEDKPRIFWVHDTADDPAFGNTNGNGGVVWTVSYSELLNIGDNNDPESYDSWPSQITIFLLDPLQVTSSNLTYEIFKTEQNDNP